jgi:branched-chain amino acid aminotransferase
MSTLANERVAWFNGKIVPEHEVRIPFRDSSWLYGDGAFDMTRSSGGKPFKLKEHMERLYRSLKYLRIDPGMSAEKISPKAESPET